MIRPWPRIASQPVFDGGLFSVTRDRTRSPRTGMERDVYVIHMVDWLMTVPLTAEGDLVMVRQYRHGSREASLEVPGGLHDGAGLLSNRVRIYLAQGVQRTAAPQPDAGEDIEVILLDPRQVPARIASGEMNNAMTVTALALASFGGHL